MTEEKIQALDAHLEALREFIATRRGPEAAAAIRHLARTMSLTIELTSDYRSLLETANGLLTQLEASTAQVEKVLGYCRVHQERAAISATAANYYSRVAHRHWEALTIIAAYTGGEGPQEVLRAD
ncbi:hypothetical protein RQ831_03845 [Roseomonas gilardii]|uniref:Uncharacterized protein n=1 Tax=Roseomonas gilardii TaxID=257708 RepID=A0ABU3MBA3_9PROT|nr:hypothetical protein [Roseomonas gilardii]MDT8330173.1 hypothetical protein [Roseomonas gilardii]